MSRLDDIINKYQYEIYANSAKRYKKWKEKGWLDIVDDDMLKNMAKGAYITENKTFDEEKIEKGYKPYYDFIKKQHEKDLNKQKLEEEEKRREREEKFKKELEEYQNQSQSYISPLSQALNFHYSSPGYNNPNLCGPINPYLCGLANPYMSRPYKNTPKIEYQSFLPQGFMEGIQQGISGLQQGLQQGLYGIQQGVQQGIYNGVDNSYQYTEPEEYYGYTSNIDNNPFMYDNGTYFDEPVTFEYKYYEYHPNQNKKDTQGMDKFKEMASRGEMKKKKLERVQKDPFVEGIFKTIKKKVEKAKIKIVHYISQYVPYLDKHSGCIIAMPVELIGESS